MRARKRQREAESYLDERRRTEHRQRLLIRELHHRVKNTLATVQAVVGSTARSAGSIDEFYHAFTGRIVSLANTHSLLTEALWQTASLRDLLEKELGPYMDERGERVILEGPEIDMPSQFAVPVGMALHELTTNAAKYGALSSASGHLRVTWSVVHSGNERLLHLDWVEEGGPVVHAPQRRGFGSQLIHRVLAIQLSAEVQSEFAPSGLRFRFSAPVPATEDSERRSTYNEALTKRESDGRPEPGTVLASAEPPAS